MEVRTLVALTSSFALCAGIASTALAASEQEANRGVKELALKEAGAAVTLKDSGPSASCDTARIVFDATTPVGRIWYATLLEALSSGASVDLSYERTGNQCRLTQVVVR